MSKYRDRTKYPKGAQPGTLRYYLARMELTIAAMEAGKITATECARRNAEYERCMRTQTFLKTLARHGFEDEPDPVAAELPDETPCVAVVETVTVKRGNTPRGPVDEVTTVTEVVKPSEE